MTTFVARLAVALGAFALAGGAALAAPEPLDADFLAAKAAYEHGQRSRLDALAARLSGHVLESYVAYWTLESRLDGASLDEVRAFVAKWPDSPLAERVRVDALKAFGKRGDWTAFGAMYPSSAGEDAELACYAVQFRRQRDGESALAAAKALWFTGQTTPEACEPLFSALIGSGELTTADRRARFRLATEAGNVRLAREIADAMPGPSRIAARDLVRVERDPARALAKGEFAWAAQGGRDLALYALDRAARSDAGAARAAWEKQRARLPDADRLYGNARIAYHAARQLHPLANEWYREASGAPLNDAQHAWRARAALRAGAWADVEAAIAGMPPALAQEPGWRYWKARALAATGRGEEARALYAGLAGEFNFYAFLAAEALGRRIEPVSQPAHPSPSLLEVFGAQPGIRRAVKLAELDMRPESQREWAFVVRGRDDESLLVAADYARSVGLYDRAINTAERTTTRHDFGLRYLTPFREHFEAAARDQATDPALLFSLARQESRFAPDIVSSAGAVGLMQLMPPTARWVAKQLGRSDYSAAQIADLAINTQFGAFYFKYCQDRLDGMPVLAAAAYNAGPNRAQAWRNGAPLEGAIWVESIPFNETRDYVKKVLANAMFYARELDLPYVPLSARLGVVPPRGGGNGNASTAAEPAAAAIAAKAP
ncbi:MAG TPA: transglycosylase SLT domain-containing protein [Casimicrobiaceae bacterium]|nr:transglycosylase SLT domain-containing protein [Casimicrobiaceae bacterium]